MRRVLAALLIVLASGCAMRWERSTLAEVAEPSSDPDAAPDTRVLRLRERTRVTGRTRGPTVLAEGERLDLRPSEWNFGEGGAWIPDPPASLTFEVERDDVPANVGLGVLIGVGIAGAVAAIVLTALGVAGFYD